MFLEGHHMEHWALGGATSLKNMVSMCSLCRARHKLHYAGCVVMPGSSDPSDDDEGFLPGIITGRSGRSATRHLGET
ncbi:MAG: HNH endonuclease, partial [Gemmatimonadaceae bacterium]|nr:HNH endonuclease [Gemmatimonadaceae bacterium]